MKQKIENANKELLAEVEKRYPGYLQSVSEFIKITIPRNQANSIYTIRSYVQADHSNSKDMTEYEKALESLDEFQKENISIFALYGIKLLLIFVDSQTEQVIATIMWDKISMDDATH